MTATAILRIVGRTRTSVSLIRARPKTGGSALARAIKGNFVFGAVSAGDNDQVACKDIADQIFNIQLSRAAGTVHTANGELASAVVAAYNKNSCPTLRPNDMWQAILTQFSFYLCDDAEELHDCFGDLKGEKTVVIIMAGNLFSADFAASANRMVIHMLAGQFEYDTAAAAGQRNDDLIPIARATDD